MSTIMSYYSISQDINIYNIHKSKKVLSRKSKTIYCMVLFIEILEKANHSEKSISVVVWDQGLEERINCKEA